MKPNLHIRFFRYFGPYWHFQLAVFIGLAIRAALFLIPPLLIRQIVDQALPAGDLRRLERLALQMIFVYSCSGILSVFYNYMGAYTAFHVSLDLMTRLYDKILKLSLRFHSNRKIGELMSRLLDDLTEARNLISYALPTLWMYSINILSTLVIIFHIDWKLSLVAISILPLYIGPTKLIGKPLKRVNSAIREGYAQMNARLQETLSGIETVKAFSQERHELNRLNSQGRQIASLQLRESNLSRVTQVCGSLIEALGPALLFWYGGRRFIEGTLSLGTIIAFSAYLANLYTPVSQVVNVFVQLIKSSAVLERFFEYLDKDSDIQELPAAVPLTKPQGLVCFEQVGFGYKPSNPVLTDISFTVYPGQVVAIVGPSGVGKSTLMRLILRFYDVSSGQITIDQQDIRQFKLVSLRQHISMVPQDVFLFNASIRENLLYGNPYASTQQVIEASQAAYIHDFIMSLPQQYETVIGERGVKLSGGQRQRVAIARAFLKNSRILLLDEATSSLDTQSEAMIQSALKALMKERTCIVIAHRLSTILDADKIIVLEKGRLVEEGTHQDLLQRSGVYARLYERQYASDV